MLQRVGESHCPRWAAVQRCDALGPKPQCILRGGVGGVTYWLTVKVRAGRLGFSSLYKPIRAEQTVGFTRRVSPSPEETWVCPLRAYNTTGWGVPLSPLGGSAALQYVGT